MAVGRFPRRMLFAVMVDDACLADTRSAQQRSAGWFAGVLECLMASFQQIDRFPKAGMQDDQIAGAVQSLLDGNIGPMATVLRGRAGFLSGHVTISKYTEEGTDTDRTVAVGQRKRTVKS